MTSFVWILMITIFFFIFYARLVQSLDTLHTYLILCPCLVNFMYISVPVQWVWIIFLVHSGRILGELWVHFRSKNLVLLLVHVIKLIFDSLTLLLKSPFFVSIYRGIFFWKCLTLIFGFFAELHSSIWTGFGQQKQQFSKRPPSTEPTLILPQRNLQPKMDEIFLFSDVEANQHQQIPKTEPITQPFIPSLSKKSPFKMFYY